MKDEATQLHSWPLRLPRPPHFRFNAVNIESSSKAQVLAGTSNKLKDDNENQWIYDLIEGFLKTLAVPGFFMDIIKNIMCDIDDGFSFCEEDDDDDDEE